MGTNSDSLKKETEKGLYLVPTPIGNLQDITLRAINILKNSDYVLCEDTRVSKILLMKYDINSKLISNHKFNEKKNIPKILRLLDKGLTISLITDAGTPCISDPGKLLVRECYKNNIKIIPLPGASSVPLAISMSGFSEKFFFYGFFPEKNKIINNDLSILSKLDTSIVFFVSAKKIYKIIPYLKKFFFGRKILICREMTKRFEEFIRGDIDTIDKIDLNLKGELTLVVSDKDNINTSQILSESDKKLIKSMINKLTVKEIVRFVSQKNDIKKKEIYNYCVKLKNEK